MFNTNLIIGSYISNHRKTDGISLNYVAECLGINKGTLSQIENGKRDIDSETLNQMLKFLDLKFECNISELIELKKEVLTFLDALIDMNRNRIDSIYKNIFKENINRNSLCYFHYLLLEYSYKLNLNNYSYELDNTFNILQEYLNVFDSFEKYLFYITASKQFSFKNNFKQSHEFLNKAKTILPKDCDSIYLGVIYHKEANMYNFKFQGFKAYQSAKDALSCFHGKPYYERQKYISISEANALSILGLYSESESINLSLLNHISVNDYELINTLYNNLSWNYILSQEYDLAIHYATLAINNHFSKYLVELNIPLALFLKGDYSKFSEVSYQFTNNNIEFIKDYILLLDSVTQNRIQNIESLSIKIIKDCQNQSNLKLLEITLIILRKYYLEQNDHYSVVKIDDELLKVLLPEIS